MVGLRIRTPGIWRISESLQKLCSCPSEYVMDNVFYYGEYEMIGNATGIKSAIAEESSTVKFHLREMRSFPKTSFIMVLAMAPILPRRLWRSA